MRNHAQKFTLRLVAKLTEKQGVTQCHRFLLQDLIEREA